MVFRSCRERQEVSPEASAPRSQETDLIPPTCLLSLAYAAGGCIMTHKSTCVSM
jgi:hypothetical protein